MMACPPARARISSLPLLLKVALVFQLQGAVVAGRATTANPSSPSSSYQPTPGVEERWVAEEEFHGASSSAESRRRIERHDKGRGRDPRPLSGHDNFGEQSWWDDDDGSNDGDGERLLLQSPSISVEEGVNAPGVKRHRLRVWKNRREISGAPSSASGDHTLVESKTKDAIPDGGPPTSEYDEEHPMRTDEWRLNVRLSRLFPTEEGDAFPECLADGTGDAKCAARVGGGRRKRQVMQFARNGYVKILDEGSGGAGGKRSKPRVGKWRIGHSGVAFDIPVQVNVRRRRRGATRGDDEDNPHSRMTVLHYHADIHLNKFGEWPRMFRGVITRDRHSSFLPPNFLRPVIGTFSAEGIGRDTADTSYKERAISLSRQQIINDAKGGVQ